MKTRSVQRLAIVALALVLASAISPAGAQQQAGKRTRVGVLTDLYPPEAGPPRAFKQHLGELGYVEGRNIVIDWRYDQGRHDRLPDLARELVRLKPDVVVADATVAVQAALQTTSTIPIVMMANADPVGVGLVPNLPRPRR